MGEALETVALVVVVIIALICLGSFITAILDKKEEEEKKRKAEEKKAKKVAPVPTEDAPTPAKSKEQSAEKKPPVLAIVASCLLGAHILGQLGGTLELTGGVFDAEVMGYTIGALSFAIAALVLMIVDTVKRSKK